MTGMEWVITGILFLILFALIGAKLKPLADKFNREYHKTYWGMWELLEHHRTEKQKEEWYNNFTLELQLNEEFKIRMKNEVLFFQKVELYQKLNGEFVLLESTVDERLEGGNAWLGFKSESAEQVYELLRLKHEKMNQQNQMETKEVV